MEKNFLNEIKNAFYSKALGIRKIKNFYVYKKKDYFGVAIENINEVMVDECFSNVFLKTEKIQINNETLNIITLMTNLVTHKDEFSYFCMQFVDDSDINNRTMILNNPLNWWNKWKELIGNKLYNPKPYDVIAELYTIKKLLLSNKEYIKWNGPVGSTIDITTNDEYYEVKSSLVRYENEVTISSQFQLLKEEKPKYLIYYKMEQLNGGESIDSIMNKLEFILGADNTLLKEIESNLEEKGYRKYSSIRKIEYLIHEIREYFVDDNFPKITFKSFKEDKIPNNIKKIYYVVNLDNIDYKTWNIGEEDESS